MKTFTYVKRQTFLVFGSCRQKHLEWLGYWSAQILNDAGDLPSSLMLLRASEAFQTGF